MVFVIAPSRVMKVNNMIAIVGSNGVIKNNLTDLVPGLHADTFECGSETRDPALIGDRDVKTERPHRFGITKIKDLAVDFVAKVESVTFDARLTGCHLKLHEFRRVRWRLRRLSKFSDFVQLSDIRLFVNSRKNRSFARKDEGSNRESA